MKKFSIVLLALLLIGGMAFADITLTGEAELALQYDLDNSEFGLVDAQDTTDVEFSLTFDSADASAMGDADVYAVIEMSGSIDWNDDAVIGTDAEIETDVAIDTAKIVGEDWEVSILGMADDFSKAVSFQDYDGDDDDDDTVAAAFGDGGGVAVTYGDYTLGADFYVAGAATYAVYAATSMEVADGVTADVAIGFDDTNAVDAGASLAYDMDGTAVSVAVDAIDNFANVDVAVATSMDMDGTTVALDAYYATNDDLYVQAAATLDAASVTVNADEILTTQVLGVEVSTSVDAIDLTVDGGYTLSTSAWDAGVEAVYAMDDWDVTLGGGYASTGAIDVTATLESSTLVDGATVYLGYEATDVTGADKGVVAAKVTIAL